MVKPDEKAKRRAAHRENVEKAGERVTMYLQARATSDPDARVALQAFMIVRSEARAERTFDMHAKMVIRELRDRVIPQMPKRKAVRR